MWNTMHCSKLPASLHCCCCSWQWSGSCCAILIRNLILGCNTYEKRHESKNNFSKRQMTTTNVTENQHYKDADVDRSMSFCDSTFLKVTFEESLNKSNICLKILLIQHFILESRFVNIAQNDRFQLKCWHHWRHSDVINIYIEWRV